MTGLALLPVYIFAIILKRLIKWNRSCRVQNFNLCLILAWWNYTILCCESGGSGK